MKNKILFLSLMSCFVLIPTALYIIVNINQALYAKDPNSYTYYKRVADFMGFGWRIKIFYMAIGSALTWLIVLLWSWAVEWKLLNK